MTTIPASQLVQINPSVVSAGGNELALSGLILTENTRVPIGQVLSFPNDGVSVSDFFGPGALETTLAEIYFAGWDNSTQKPANVLFAQYPGTATAAYLRGGPVGASLTLAQLNALAAGILTISINGTPHVSSSIDLSSAASFSAAAAAIQAAFTTPPFEVTYDSVSSAFVFATTATGSAETIGYCTTDTLATSLELTAAAGATLSQGADVAVPGAFMAGVATVTQDWATFMTAFDPDGGSGNTLKQAFALWTNQQNFRYMYVAWDTDITPTQSTDAVASLGNIVNALGYNGTFPVYDPTNGPEIAAFVCGVTGSIDFAATNGRITFAFKGQAGLVAGVTTATAAANLKANGYNFYAAYATAAQQFIQLQPGQISGKFAWADSYVNQIWFTNELQVDLMTFLSTVNSVAYITAGYELIQSACRQAINEALNNGVIAVGVPLSSSEAIAVNTAAGVKIDDTLTNFGWFLQIKPAIPSVRVARTSPPITLWFTDGQSIQQLVLNSDLVQ